MSEGLWISTPGFLWVSEDHVLALADVLWHSARVIEGVTSHLAGLDTSSPDLVLPLASLTGADLVGIRAGLALLGDDTRWLYTALAAYAHSTAQSERSRIAFFDGPRDHLIALAIVSATGYQPRVDYQDWGAAEAARAVLGDDFLPGPIMVSAIEGVDDVGQGRAVTMEARIERIPSGENPIRIERFTRVDGADDFDVFIAGTQEWSVGTSSEPFDMESNLALVAGVSAASLVAVELAMKKSGIRPGDRVSFTGHSQGGLVAARLAESGRYATTGLLTAGAPLGNAHIRGSYPAVALAHSDDVVPRLGGHQQEGQATTIERNSGSRLGDVAGAHSRKAYATTARMADNSPAHSQLPTFPTSGEPARVEVFTAVREEKP